VIGYEKRDHFQNFLFNNTYLGKTHTLESIVATDFNFGVMILTSFSSGLGGASVQVDCVRKLPLYASLWWFTVWYRGLSRRPKLSSGKLGTLIALEW